MNLSCGMHCTKFWYDHVRQSSWTHGGKVYGFGGFGSAPVDDYEDDEEYPSFMRVVFDFYGSTSRCWNNQVSENKITCCKYVQASPLTVTVLKVSLKAIVTIRWLSV